jgi:hypothetical protein
MSDESSVPERQTLKDKFLDVVVPGRKSARELKQKSPKAVDEETGQLDKGVDAGQLGTSWDDTFKK